MRPSAYTSSNSHSLPNGSSQVQARQQQREAQELSKLKPPLAPPPHADNSISVASAPTPPPTLSARAPSDPTPKPTAATASKAGSDFSSAAEVDGGSVPTAVPVARGGAPAPSSSITIPARRKPAEPSKDGGLLTGVARSLCFHDPAVQGSPGDPAKPQPQPSAHSLHGGGATAAVAVNSRGSVELTVEEMADLMSSGCLSPPPGKSDAALMEQMHAMMHSLRGDTPLVRLHIKLVEQPPPPPPQAASAAPAPMPSMSSGLKSSSSSALASLLGPPADSQDIVAGGVDLQRKKSSSAELPSGAYPNPNPSPSLSFAAALGINLGLPSTSAPAGGVTASSAGAVAPPKPSPPSSSDSSLLGQSKVTMSTLLSKFGLCRKVEVDDEVPPGPGPGSGGVAPPGRDSSSAPGAGGRVDPPLMLVRLEVAGGGLINLNIPSPHRKSRRTPSHEAINIIASKYKVQRIPPPYQSGPPALLPGEEAACALPSFTGMPRHVEEEAAGGGSAGGALPSSLAPPTSMAAAAGGPRRGSRSGAGQAGGAGQGSGEGTAAQGDEAASSAGVARGEDDVEVQAGEAGGQQQQQQEQRQWTGFMSTSAPTASSSMQHLQHPAPAATSEGGVAPAPAPSVPPSTTQQQQGEQEGDEQAPLPGSALMGEGGDLAELSCSSRASAMTQPQSESRGGTWRAAAAASTPLDPAAEKRRKEACAVYGERWATRVKRIQRESPQGRREGWALRCVIVKSGDDCRQELLAVQVRGGGGRRCRCVCGGEVLLAVQVGGGDEAGRGGAGRSCLQCKWVAKGRREQGGKGAGEEGSDWAGGWG